MAESKIQNGTNNGPRTSFNKQSRTNQDKVKLCVEAYSTLKRQLETIERRLDVFWYHPDLFERLNVKDWIRKWIKRRWALSANVCQTIFFKTSSTSASKSGSCQRNVRPQSTKEERLLQKKRNSLFDCCAYANYSHRFHFWKLYGLCASFYFQSLWSNIVRIEWWNEPYHNRGQFDK